MNQHSDHHHAHDPADPAGVAETERDCLATLRELDVFLDGELSEDQCAAIRHHLEACIDCFGAFDFHAELKQVIAEKCQNDALPSDLVARIEQCFG